MDSEWGEGELITFLFWERLSIALGGKGSGVCIAFLDIEKAYNRVDRFILWWVLENIGVCGNLTEIIKSMYRGTRAIFILGDISTDWIGSKGVRDKDVATLPLLLLSIPTSLLTLTRNTKPTAFNIY